MKKVNRKLRTFDHGVLFAVALLMRQHDQPVIAADVLYNAGLANAHCSEMDEFDKESLRKLANEPKLNLRGL